MKFLLAIFLFLTLLGDGLKQASRINRGVQEAEALYLRGQYRQAEALYQYLADSLQVDDDELLLNQAHAAFLAGDEAKATRNYTLLARKPDLLLQSVATTQLGLIYFRKENPERALYSFKKALILDPTNETARFNYELVKKYLAANPSLANQRKQNRQKPRPGQNPETGGQSTPASPSQEGTQGTARDDQAEGANPPTDRPDAAGANNRGGSGAPGERQPQPGGPGNRQETPQGQQGKGPKGLSEVAGSNGPGSRNKEGSEAVSQQEKQMQTLRARLQEADLSPEKATQLLEAIRNAELQYLQQVPRQPKRPRQASRPDW